MTPGFILVIHIAMSALYTILDCLSIKQIVLRILFLKPI